VSLTFSIGVDDLLLVCGLPAEYCEFGPDFNRCKPWLIEHCPEVYPSLVKKEGEEGGEKGTPPLG
jgi:hypothetical protein